MNKAGTRSFLKVYVSKLPPMLSINDAGGTSESGLSMASLLSSHPILVGALQGTRTQRFPGRPVPGRGGLPAPSLQAWTLDLSAYSETPSLLGLVPP